ncbi:MAG TPA: RNA polymerase sigma factor [Streptosporangiaceae bacterium]|nr:RNA polymerase sigma factor [Streptosporangiaceae bacterium]
MRADNARRSHAAPGHQVQPDDATVIGLSMSDPEKFAVVFRRHVGAIQRYVTRRIGPGQADDVVAETFLVAFRQRAGYRDDGRDCLPWLYGIATNLVGRHWRTEVRQLRLLARTGADPVTEAFTDRVDAAVTAGSAKGRLAAALAGLPASQRDALLLVAWAGLSYDQAALAIGVPLGTVQSRVSRARRRLRQQLADLDPASRGEDEPAGPVTTAAGFVLPPSPAPLRVLPTRSPVPGDQR